MRLLELFSGSGHISNHFRKRGYETITLDLYTPADIQQDILTWDYKAYNKDYFDFIWASPDCVSWSVATTKHRTLKEGLTPKTETAILGERLILKTLEIIKYFNPKYYVIENPRGKLRHFPPMLEIPYRTTSFYINYDFPTHKPTDLWSNIYLWEKERPCKKSLIIWEKYKKSKRSLIPNRLIQKIYNQIHY